jgi:threonine synthase
MSIWRFADRFQSADAAASRVTLGEGDTPVVRSRKLGPKVGAPNLFFKLETGNPSGSYKDRFAAAAVSEMVARGQERCVGDVQRQYGLGTRCILRRGGHRVRDRDRRRTAPQEKLKQMMAYGARIFKVRGFGVDPTITTDTVARIRERGSLPGAALQISAYACSPIGMTGVQTIGYELDEQLNGAIDHVFIPAGGGGLTLAIARGFDGSKARPRIECVQPEGNATIAGPLREGADRGRTVQCTTRIGGLQVPTVLDGDAVIAACRQSGGTGHLVRDEDIWAVQARLAREEGIFCEPAGAVSVVAALAAIARGEVARDATVCCVITGTGFKDAPSLDRMLAESSCPTIELSELRVE